MLGVVTLLAQTPPANDTIDIVQFGFMGVALLWLALGKVRPEGQIKELQAQITELNRVIAEERADSKAVRDAIIKDVAPTMARVADRDKELADLVTRLLAWALSQDSK